MPQPDTTLVATLIAGPHAKLSPALLNDFIQLSEKAGAQMPRSAWLAENEAADLFAGGIKPDAWRALFTETIADEPIDVIVQPAATRRKKLLAADMESTIIQQELLDELAAEIGVHDKVAAITKRAMNGEIDFGAALRERVALFADKPVAILEAAARRITLMPGAATLAATMKTHGAKLWLITGGFSFFAEPVAAELGFNASHANELILKDGILTGETRAPILDRGRKRALLEAACAEFNLPLAQSMSVGDGANDVPMLSLCNENGGLGIAYHAKPKVREQIPNQINHADLTALLYAQGYKKDEFVIAR